MNPFYKQLEVKKNRTWFLFGNRQRTSQYGTKNVKTHYRTTPANTTTRRRNNT